MTEYPIALEEIVQWLRSAPLSGTFKVSNVKQRIEYVPAACADFEGPETTGRISGWVTGEFDFEVIRSADACQTFFQHQTVTQIDAPALATALSAFLSALH